MTRVAPLDRRTPPRGDRRREALLAALEEQLRTRTMDEVNVADLTREAGVTRSAFYFYFDNKAAAVAALMSGIHTAAFEATDVLVGGGGTPMARVETVLGRLFDLVEANPHVYRAMLDARAAHEGVRRTYETERDAFVEPLAAMIRAERAAGRAPDGPDPTALASVLLQVNEAALERVALGTAPDREAHLAAITAVWVRSIHGRVDDALADDPTGGAR